MNFRLLGSISTIVALVIASPCLAEEAKTFTLRYKFKTGDVVRYEVVHNASVRTTMDKVTQKAQSRSESTKAWKVIDVLPSGEIEFQNVVERVKMSNRLPNRAEMVYDSVKDETPPPGFEDAAKAIGTPLSQVRMTAWGKVTEREVKHYQPAADPHAPIAVLLPEEPVAVGDSWNEPIEVKVKLEEGGTKVIQTRRHFELTGVKHGVATIKAMHQALSPVTAPIEAQLAQRLMKGVVRFDIKAGRLLSQDFQVDKRVLGFAGPTSSMHYVMQMRERLAEEKESVAQRP